MRLAYIQVGGGADGAADAAPSPARCARGRRSQAHARTKKRTNGNQRRRRRGRSPLTRLAKRPAYSVAPCLDFHRYAGRYVFFGSPKRSSRLQCSFRRHVRDRFFTVPRKCYFFTNDGSVRAWLLNKRAVFLPSRNMRFTYV